MTETVKIEIYADNLGVTQAIATKLAQLVSAGTIILLEGNLGSGKTTFMQAFGRAFTLIDEYTEGRLPLYHIDLYRLEPSQVPSLHLEEYWRGEDLPLGVVAIEWASKLLTIPPNHLKINLSSPINSQNKKEEAKNLNLNLEDDLEVFSEARLIYLIAQGKPYVDILTALCAEAEIKILVKK
jgi:tRNA threonylcarbamoyladenosine biosynthesis protein TsaE